MIDLTIDQPSLNRALRLVSRVAPTKATLPVLQTVLIEGETGHLTLTATDGEVGVVTTLAADVATPGQTAVPARLISDYVAQLPARPLRLTREPAHPWLQVRCDRCVADLATIDPEGFPPLPPADDHQARDLDAGPLRAAIARVAFAAARDDSRPALAAVLFDFHADGLTLAAADGFRLARAQLPEVPGEAQQLLVPARAVAEFGRLLADGDTARLAVTPDGRGMHLGAGATRIVTRLVDGRFPDVDRVIPTQWRTRVRMALTDFRQATRLTSLFGTGGDPRPVVLDAAPGRLCLRGRSDECGEAESEIPAAVEGAPQAVALNARLLTDLLDAASDPELEIAWTGPDAPVVLREAGRAASADLWLVMPLYDAALARQGKEAA